MARLLFLGSGGSMGVPVIGCQCAVCQSDSPLNKRLRPSVLIESDGKSLLIDSGPDFRQQALHYQIERLDGVIITHAHHDHTGGLDDLRVYYMWSKKSIPMLCSQSTFDELMTRYSYIFSPNPYEYKLTSRLAVQILPGERGDVNFLGFQFRFVTYVQAGMAVNGFRFGNLAFISDIREYPESIYEDLKGIDYLVISALRHQPSPLHFSIEESIAFADKIGVKKVWLTHLAHEVDYESTQSLLPSNAYLAYDGLSIEFDM